MSISDAQTCVEKGSFGVHNEAISQRKACKSHYKRRQKNSPVLELRPGRHSKGKQQSCSQHSRAPVHYYLCPSVLSSGCCEGVVSDWQWGEVLEVVEDVVGPGGHETRTADGSSGVDGLQRSASRLHLTGKHYSLTVSVYFQSLECRSVGIGFPLDRGDNSALSAYWLWPSESESRAWTAVRLWLPALSSGQLNG